jgi:ribonuclease D
MRTAVPSPRGGRDAAREPVEDLTTGCPTVVLVPARDDVPVTLGDDGPQPAPALVRLDTPRDGVPPVVTDAAGLAAVAAAFAAGTGPVAVDAERASGHRYGQRAFLVQLRRAGAGTALVDPAALPDLSTLGDAIAGAEWVLHAASQDLPCLADVGLRPRRIFDTELGSRLAGFQRVGLAAVVEQLLGLSLAKEHSAVDWSTRPLPEPWLRYAALDVEVLVDVRDALAAELERQGKLDWAHEEFAAVVATPPAQPRVDPWRRTSQLHRVRSRRQLAAVRELWTARDRLAQEQDVSPGRILPDASIIAAVTGAPATPRDLIELPGFTGRGARRHVALWFDALARARRLGDSELPVHTLPSEGPPPPRVWPERDPVAAARLTRCRAAVTAIAAEHALPAENLLAPDTVRRLAWEPPAGGAPSLADVEGFLREHGARDWQVRLCGAALAACLPAPDPIDDADPIDNPDPIDDPDSIDDPEAADPAVGG